MTWHEKPIVFECEGDRLIGIATVPERPIDTGVLIIVGGPQYRAGSHRQFTLLARQLGDQGIASLRFDYRGMGDSEGDFRNFEVIDQDIRAAIDTFQTQVPEIEHVALWGLCDAASAALYYGHTDPRVNKLILLNPWVHSEAGAARARLRHYYLSRLLQKSFWTKLFSGQVKLAESAGHLAQSARQAASSDPALAAPVDPRHGSAGYVDRMLRGLKRFGGDVHVVLSGQDLTAAEFAELMAQDKGWHKACNDRRVAVASLKEANHTFSTRSWRAQVAEWTAQWLGKGLASQTAGTVTRQRPGAGEQQTS
jgi:exosortase A-associated hydrolase 1